MAGGLVSCTISPKISGVVGCFCRKQNILWLRTTTERTFHPTEQDTKGTLKPGADADMVLLSDDLDVLVTFLDGEVGYVADDYELHTSQPRGHGH